MEEVWFGLEGLGLALPKVATFREGGTGRMRRRVALDDPGPSAAETTPEMTAGNSVRASAAVASEASTGRPTERVSEVRVEAEGMEVRGAPFPFFPSTTTVETSLDPMTRGTGAGVVGRRWSAERIILDRKIRFPFKGRAPGIRALVVGH